MRIRADKAKVLGAYKLKQPHIPEGFVLVQDTREQAPLFARLPAGLMIKSTALKWETIASWDLKTALP